MSAHSTTRRNTALRGAVAIIEQDGKILMQRRREHIADPGTWVLPGGECRKGEQTRAALIRVCAEELGITVRPSKEIGILELGDIPCPVWHVVWKGKDVKLGGEDIVGIGWFTLEELMELSPIRHGEELRNFMKDNEFFKKVIEVEEVLEIEKNPKTLQTSTTSKTSRTSDSPSTISNIADEDRITELVQRSKDGEHEAFAKIYDIYITPVYRYVSFRLHPAAVEDVVSDVFVKAWEKLDSYKGMEKTPFSSWLFRIAKHIVIDTYRTQKDVIELNEYHVDEDRWNDPMLRITQNVQAMLLKQAMNKLPNRYREVLLLSFMSGLNHVEIARSLRLREGAVRILKHRALKKLGELLPASMRDELP